MKKFLCIAIVMLIVSASFSQTDSTKKVAKDSVKTYVLILNDQEINALFSVIKTADEKPSLINAWLQFINSRATLLPKQKETATAPAGKKKE